MWMAHKFVINIPEYSQILLKMCQNKVNFKFDLPMDFLKAWLKASVFDISKEKISEPANIVKGVSSPSDFAIPMLQLQRNMLRFQTQI